MTLTVAPNLSLKIYTTFKTLNSSVTDPETSAIWFPIPDSMSGLPPVPAYDTNSELLAYNSTAAPNWFDPTQVDLEQFFNDLLPVDVEPVYPVELDTNLAIPVQTEIIPVDCVLHCRRRVYNAEYSLAPESTNVTLPIRLYCNAIKTLTGEATSYIYSGKSAEVAKIIDPSAKNGSFVLSGKIAQFRASVTRLQLEVGAFHVEEARTISIFRAEGTYLDLQEESDIYVLNSANVFNTFEAAKFGASCIEGATTNALMLITRRPGSTQVTASDDFTLSAWFAPTVLPGSFTAYPIIGLTATTGIFLYNLNNINLLGYGYIRTDGIGDYTISDQKTFTLLADTGVPIDTAAFGDPEIFHHIAVEVLNGQLRLYVDGVSSLPINSPGIVLNEDNGISFFDLNSGLVNTAPVPVLNYSGQGYIDDIIIDKAARYGGQSFVLPTEQTIAYSSTKFTIQKKIKADPSTFSSNGQDALFALITRALKGELGFVSVSGEASNYRQTNSKLYASAADFNFTGQSTLEGPVFVSGAYTTYSYISGSPRVFSLPSGYAIDDIAILVVETSGDAPLFSEINGWTLFNNQPTTNQASSAGSSLYIWWRRIKSTIEPPIALFVTDHAAAAIFLVRGAVNSGDPFAGFSTQTTTTASTTMTSAPVTVSNPATLVCTVAARPFDSASTTFYSGVTNSSLTSITEQFEVGTTSGNGGGFVLFTGKRLQSGTVTATTATKTNSTTDVVVVLALKSSAGENVSIPLRSLNADKAIYALTGNSNVLTSSRKIYPLPGVLSIAGQDATFMTGVILIASASTYTLSGQAVSFNRNYAINGAVTSYAVSGQNATLTYSGAIGTLGDQFELTALLEDDLLVMDF